MRLIQFLLFALLLTRTFQKCGYNPEKQQKIKVEKLDLYKGEEYLRFLESTFWSPIRIYVDYTHLHSQAALVSESYIHSIKEVMSQVVTAYSNLISVKQSNNVLKLSWCNDLKIGSEVSIAGLDAELIIFPYMDSDLPSDIEAGATFCSQDSSTNRPIAGDIVFNSQLDFKNKQNAIYYISLLVFHEIFLSARSCSVNSLPKTGSQFPYLK